MLILRADIEEIATNSMGFYTTYEWVAFPVDHYPVVQINNQFTVVFTREQLALCQFLVIHPTVYFLPKKLINTLTGNRFSRCLKKEQLHECDMSIPDTLLDSSVNKLFGMVHTLVKLKDKYGTCNLEKMGHLFPGNDAALFVISFKLFLMQQPETNSWTEFQINYCWDTVLEKVVEKVKTVKSTSTYDDEATIFEGKFLEMLRKGAEHVQHIIP